MSVANLMQVNVHIANTLRPERNPHVDTRNPGWVELMLAAYLQLTCIKMHSSLIHEIATRAVPPFTEHPL